MNRLLLLLLFFTSPLLAQGHWSGGISLGGWYPIEVDLDAASIVPNRGKAQRLENIRAEDSRISFEWPEEGEPRARFDGVFKGDVIEGTFVQGETRAPFRVMRTARVAPEAFDAVRGLYTDGERLLWIGRMSELRLHPVYIDPQSGRFGPLFPQSATEWVTADGRVECCARYRRIHCCIEEEVTWRHGAVTLSGTLVKPANAKGRVPAMVLVHGSGGARRTYFSSLPYLLAHRGIAALIYDKRGSGQSTGNRHTSTFYDLADDATRGAQLLAARADIDPNRIGIFGHSQGGWVAPLAAHRSQLFRFAVSAAGPAVSVDDEIRSEKRAAMKGSTLTEAEKQKVLDAIDLYFDVRLRRAKWEDLAKAIEEAKGKPYDRFIFHPKSEADVLKDLEDYDPAPVLRSLRKPLLAMYAENDPAVTPELNVPRLKAHLAAAGNRVSTIRVFAGADHDFIADSTDPMAGGRYAEGYLGFVLRWIGRQVAE